MSDLVKVFTCKIKQVQSYFIDVTKSYDDEKWFLRIDWDKVTNDVVITNDYWSGDSLPFLTKMKKISCHLKKKKIIVFSTQQKGYL